MTETHIKNLLKTLKFTSKNGANNIYIKTYPQHNYSVEVDFNTQKINYGDRIIKGNETSSNFTKEENFVDLECVDRLLEKGYKPENIYLEMVYPAGRNHSGNLDILVYDNDKKPFLMIECKTWGAEHTKEYNKMLKDGGQLFTYYGFDTDTKYLCLYSSRCIGGAIDYKNDIIQTCEEWKALSGTKERYSYWNKTFKDNGIFESYASPYDIKHKALTYGMLKDIKEEDSGKIFNQIMEILRHNVVSDKPNAFNKLLNLFVCKIIDENKNIDDELSFQWLETDTDESLQMRLNDLYKDGMWRFLNINVIDYSESEVNNALKGLHADEVFKQTIKNMFIETRLKKSPNFAFKEVLNQKSFEANSQIVREIVELLQDYRFRYKQKHQFLGDFFELLLNTSMKQESGQFFTPVPITRFIISSLPIKEFIADKILKNDDDILPFAIDYAAGSGHFLTEYMEQVQNIIENADGLKTAPTIKNKLNAWKDSVKFDWAKEYVYGIDLDDRLVKTAKVSAFFNGDGEANIIWGNGLDNFKNSTEYRDKLKITDKFDEKNNGQFDILISNPPYSVEAFKSTLKKGEETFELYNSLTDNSSEIECLFVERMKQLLKVGGWAGVILPVSILSNSGIHSKAREIIFKYFKVKSVVELGSNTFMATGTNTVILFLERREDGDYREIENAVDNFFDNKKDVTVRGTEHIFSKYVANVYDGLSFDNYINIIKGQEVQHELYNDYKKIYGEDLAKIKEVEKEKLLYFILTYNQEAVIVKTGKQQEEKKFLGYEFSNRRGHEGLHWLPNGTMLYNDSNLLDSTKANSYIYNAFKGIKNDIDESLVKNVSYGRMSNYFEYGTSNFDKRVNLNKRKIVADFDSKYGEEKISVLVDLIKGVNYGKHEQVYDETDNVVLTADNITLDCKFEINKKVFVSQNKNFDESKKIKKDDIFICFSSGSKNHVGKCAYINDDTGYYAGGFMGLLRKKSNDIVMQYLFSVLSSGEFRKIISEMSTGANINNLSNALGDIKIPLPPLDIQKKIVEEIGKVDDEYNTTRMTVEIYRQKIENIFNDMGIIGKAGGG